MSNSSPEALYDLSLKELCDSMTEEVMQHVLKWYPPSIVLQIIWKSLHIKNENLRSDKFTLIAESPNRGQQLAQMNLHSTENVSPVPYSKLKDEFHEKFAKTQQTEFVDKCNFCNHFDLQLFFKLVEISEHRNELFTIFQICIQIKGFEFPKQFAEEWITSEKQDTNDEMHFHFIEQGLKLGIFLGDSGWLNESASVLSHTYKIINTKWVCHDRNLKLIKITQCLTKWLLVITNYHNFDEAKVVLQHMLPTIEILENIEGRTLCIAYAYVSVSQYYFVLMEYNEAWSWAVKAINELHDKSADVLKLLVISHTIKVCSVLNKLSTAKKLIDQLHAYDKDIDQNVYVDMLLNEACYSLRADLALDSIYSYYAALDSKRNLFGYYNLHTAIVFVDYAYARYVCDYSTTDFNEALRSVLQGIFIMEKIGLPSNNMLLVNAGRIKALILEERALDILDDDESGYAYGVLHEGSIIIPGSFMKLYKQTKVAMLCEAEALHLKALEVSVKAVGVNTLLTAKSYCNLGRVYQSQKEYVKSEEAHLKAIEIKQSILGKDNPEVALSLGHLASLYTYQLQRYREAEVLYLRSKKIYETTYGPQYTGLMYDLQGLAEIYRELNDVEKFSQHLEQLLNFKETREAWLHLVHTAVDVKCTKEDLSLEKFKCILNDCACES